MPVIHIPAPLRHLSGDRARIEVAGASLRQVFAALERECPGLTARIVDHDDLRTDMAVAIDGSILEGGGLSQPVRPDTEIYLVPPIGGGGDRSRWALPGVRRPQRPVRKRYVTSTPRVPMRTFDGGESAP